jgi:hypothetical protein
MHVCMYVYILCKAQPHLQRHAIKKKNTTAPTLRILLSLASSYYSITSILKLLYISHPCTLPFIHRPHSTPPLPSSIFTVSSYSYIPGVLICVSSGGVALKLIQQGGNKRLYAGGWAWPFLFFPSHFLLFSLFSSLSGGVALKLIQQGGAKRLYAGGWAWLCLHIPRIQITYVIYEGLRSRYRSRCS